MGCPGVPAATELGWMITMLSWASPRPNTASASNVTGSRFIVFGRPTLTSSPVRVTCPFQGLTCSLTSFRAHPRRSSGSFTGISTGLPVSAPVALRTWCRNFTRTLTVTTLSALRLST
jgi:hypothetical protein